MNAFKHHFAFAMTFFLLFSNIGLAINVHYCGDTIDQVTFGYPQNVTDDCFSEFEVEQSCCRNKETLHEKSTSDKCCADESLKQKVDQLVVKTFKVQHDVFVPIRFETPSFFTFPVFVALQKQNVAFYCETHAPPLYQLYHQYLFYA